MAAASNAASSSWATQREAVARGRQRAAAVRPVWPAMAHGGGVCARELQAHSEEEEEEEEEGKEKKRKEKE